MGQDNHGTLGLDRIDGELFHQCSSKNFIYEIRGRAGFEQDDNDVTTHTTLVPLLPEQKIGELKDFVLQNWLMVPADADFDGCWATANRVEAGDFVISVADMAPVLAWSFGGSEEIDVGRSPSKTWLKRGGFGWVSRVYEVVVEGTGALARRYQVIFQGDSDERGDIVERTFDVACGNIKKIRTTQRPQSESGFLRGRDDSAFDGYAVDINELGRYQTRYMRQEGIWREVFVFHEVDSAGKRIFPHVESGGSLFRKMGRMIFGPGPHSSPGVEVDQALGVEDHAIFSGRIGESSLPLFRFVCAKEQARKSVLLPPMQKFRSALDRSDAALRTLFCGAPDTPEDIAVASSINNGDTPSEDPKRSKDCDAKGKPKQRAKGKPKLLPRTDGTSRPPPACASSPASESNKIPSKIRGASDPHIRAILGAASCLFFPRGTDCRQQQLTGSAWYDFRRRDPTGLCLKSVLDERRSLQIQFKTELHEWQRQFWLLSGTQVGFSKERTELFAVLSTALEFHQLTGEASERETIFTDEFFRTKYERMQKNPKTRYGVTFSNAHSTMHSFLRVCHYSMLVQYVPPVTVCGVIIMWCGGAV